MDCLLKWRKNFQKDCIILFTNGKKHAIYFDSVEAFILKKTSSYFLQNKRIFTLQTLVDLGSDLRDNVYASVRKKEN